MRQLNGLFIDGVHVGHDTPCYRTAKECGASAVKLQKRQNETLYTSEFYNRLYESENSFGRTYGAHRDALEFGQAEYEELRGHDSGIAMAVDEALSFEMLVAEPVLSSVEHGLAPAFGYGS